MPDVQVLAANVNMRATFLAGGQGITRAPSTRRRSTSRRPSRTCSASPSRSTARALSCWALAKGGAKRVDIIGLNDFHGQLDPATLAFDGINANVGGAALLATMFDEESARCPGHGLILAAGDNVGASPPNSALLQDMPAIDVENAWGLDATSLATTSSTTGSTALHTSRGRTSRSWPPTRRDRDREDPVVSQAVPVFMSTAFRSA